MERPIRRDLLGEIPAFAGMTVGRREWRSGGLTVGRDEGLSAKGTDDCVRVPHGFLCAGVDGGLDSRLRGNDGLGGLTVGDGDDGLGGAAGGDGIEGVTWDCVGVLHGFLCAKVDGGLDSHLRGNYGRGWD